MDEFLRYFYLHGNFTNLIKCLRFSLAMTSVLGSIYSFFRSIISVVFLYGFCYGAMQVCIWILFLFILMTLFKFNCCTKYCLFLSVYTFCSHILLLLSLGIPRLQRISCLINITLLCFLFRQLQKSSIFISQSSVVFSWLFVIISLGAQAILPFFG